jgi:phosphohistidine phosphatase
MKQLFLLRHAKAAKADGYADDRDRPLDPQGVRDIIALAPRLHLLPEFRPERVLCSPSVRTRQTLTHLAADSTVSEAETLFDPALYLALAAQLFLLVQTQPDSLSSLLIVGHNPGLHQLAISLAGQGETMDLQLITRTFPPLSFVRLSFEAARWQDITLASGTLDHFLFPERYQTGEAA